ncbi:serine endoprotease [Maioricimonas rarisocia]|uniref:Serine endoprotease n=1 Tax=Maioricimonas rarisocia TaxID=2528026 RepID=A0A517Z9P8_9PLAN|nr:GYF domain-containing protein [Maioricimonas rarisocia]QDU39212.1 serine endoprotease [Maioricimonas rarisocia]
MSDASETSYFIRLRGTIRGPYTVLQLRRMARTGQFSRLHQISENRVAWRSAHELRELFGGPQPAPAAEASPQSMPSSPAPAEPKSPAEEWMYAVGDATLGPVSRRELLRRLERGELTASTPVWREGLADWSDAGTEFPSHVRTRGSGRRKAMWAGIGLGVCLLIVAAVLKWAPQFDAGELKEAVFSSEIDSTDLSVPAVNQAISDATGMVVSYLLIRKQTGEEFEQRLGSGSCFVVDRKGNALTNRHVIEEYEAWKKASTEGRLRRLIDLNTQWLAQLYKERQIDGDPPDVDTYIRDEVDSIDPRLVVYFGTDQCPASLEYTSKRHDMAVLHVQREKHEAYYPLSASNEAAKLTPVVTIGFPGVAQRAVTDVEQAAILARAAPSSLDEVLFGSRDHRDGIKGSAFEVNTTPGEITIVQKETGDVHLVQHTAVVRPGNSGGPLVLRRGGMAGVVLGINTLILVDDSPVYVAFTVAQMRSELEDEAGLTELTWR